MLDPDGRLLLLDCTDPARPGTRWQELPGGGVEPGEDGVTATVRELREETGLEVDPVPVDPLQRTAQELAAHDGRFFARDVPALLARPLAGERVDQPSDAGDGPLGT